MAFVRDPSIPLPTVWRKFDAVDKQGNMRKFIIQDYTEDISDTFKEYLLHHFLKEEPVAKSLGLIDEIEKNDLWNIFWEYWQDFLKDRISLICYEELPDGTLKFAGFNCLDVVTHEKIMEKKEHSEKYADQKEKTPAGKIMSAFYGYCAEKVNILDHYKVDKFVCGKGLFVVPEFRGLKISQHLIAAREPLCRALGIKATMTSCSAIGSQKASQNCGHIILLSIPYDSDEARRFGIDYRNIEHTDCKVFGIKYFD